MSKTAYTLLKFLRNPADFNAVNLDKKNITDDDCAKLATALKFNKTVTSLNLDNNQIGDEGAATIVKALEVNKTVALLSFFNNQIGDEGVAAIGKALKVNKTFTLLHLQSNQISDEGAAAIGKALKSNNTIVKLFLNHNQIGDEGTASLAEGLKVNKTVTELNLAQNQIGEAGAASLAEILKVNKTVTQIHLHHNQIGDQGAASLAEGLKVNKTVTELNLDNNQIGDQGVAAIGKALKVNKTVTSLNLDNNQIGDEGTASLAEGLKVNKIVTELNLGHNQIGNKGLPLLIASWQGRGGNLSVDSQDQAAIKIRINREVAEKLAKEKAILEAKQKAEKEAAEQAAKAKAEQDAQDLSIQAEQAYKAGNYNEALAKYDAAIKLSPSKVYYVGKATALKEFGKYAEAMEAADKALAIDPNYEVAKEQKELAFIKQQKEEIMKLKEQEAKEATIREIFDLIGEGDARIQDNVEKGILLLGRTGAGKSTLTHLLAKKQLKATVDDSTGKITVEAVETLPNITIGQDDASETKVPGKLVFGDVTIWDCPGFKDTGGIVQEIANAFYIRRLFETTGKLKFVLTMSESAIADDKGSNAVAIIDQFARLFTDTAAIENCVSLVVTRVPSHKNATQLMNNLQNIINKNPLFQNSENAKQVAQFLLKSVHVFNAPAVEGLMPGSDLLREIEAAGNYLPSKANLANLAIEKASIPYTKSLLATSQLSLAKLTDIIILAVKGANLCMHDHEKNVFVNSCDFIKNWLPKSIFGHVLPEVNNNEGTKYFANLDQLQALANSLPDAYDPITAKQTITNLLNVFKDFSHSPELKSLVGQYIHVFQQQMEYVKFLSNVCGEIADYSYVINAIKPCKAVLNNELKNQITSLKLRDDADLAYYDKAIKYLDLYPKECAKITAKCYDRIGDIHEAKEQHKTALASYLTALKLDKALPETYEKVGELLFNDHNYAGALKYFKVVNNIIKVAECFGELIKQNPKDAGLRLEKGDYYLSIGLHEKAVVYYKQAFSLSKDGAFKANVLKKQSSAMKDHSQKLAIKAQDLGHQAENMNFYNFDEINFSDLEGYQLSVTGDDAGLGAIL